MLCVEANVEEIGQDRVRLTIEVSSADLKHAFDHAANDLAIETKIPGFRKGKVPMPVLVKRVGLERIYTEAIESHIGGWFQVAAAQERIRPVSQPNLEFELPTSTDSGWSFSAEVDVQPKPELADWTTLEVGKAEAQIPEGLVEHELDALRASVAELVPVEGRPVAEGDTLIVDLVSEKGEASRDYVVELGAEQLVGELEQGLIGMQVGASKEITFHLVDGTTTGVTAAVKEIKEKVLPPLDDELARTASEFETLAELRDDIESRLRAQIDAELEAAFREATIDALVEASTVNAEGPLVESRARELLAALARSLERRGISLDLYLELTGQEAPALAENLRGEARQSVARELVLEAVADQLGIEISDSEVEEYLRGQAELTGEDADELVAAVWQHGRQEALRDDLRMSAALDRVASEVKPIPLEQAEARKQIWTPEQEKAPSTTKLWTPGSKETP